MHREGEGEAVIEGDLEVIIEAEEADPVVEMVKVLRMEMRITEEGIQAMFHPNYASFIQPHIHTLFSCFTPTSFLLACPLFEASFHTCWLEFQPSVRALPIHTSALTLFTIHCII